MQKVLAVLDVQKDFLINGNYPIIDADKKIPYINKLIDKFQLVVATQNWFPPNHKCFIDNNKNKEIYDSVYSAGMKQTILPKHCVQFTEGACFPETLQYSKFTKIFVKGVDPLVSSYSGFFDFGRRHTTMMGEWLKGKGIKTITLVGFALDDVVRNTALDAIAAGFYVEIDLKGCAGRDKKRSDQCVFEMAESGCTIIQ